MQSQPARAPVDVGQAQLPDISRAQGQPGEEEKNSAVPYLDRRIGATGGYDLFDLCGGYGARDGRKPATNSGWHRMEERRGAFTLNDGEAQEGAQHGDRHAHG